MLLGTGIAAVSGKLPGAEPGPYILRFDEDRPNPLYRRVCYSFAWTAALTYATLNLEGLMIPVVGGGWQMKPIYSYGYPPVAAVILLIGLTGNLPRVGPSTRGRRHRAALLLRLGLGGHRGADVAADSVEDPADQPRHQLGEAGSLCGRAGVHGQPGVSGGAATHTTDFPGESMVAD